jgi:transposase-like protein
LCVPLPPRGYWSRLAAGKPLPPRPELPAIQIADAGAPVNPIRTYTIEERSSIVTKVSCEIAKGQTLAAACRQAGISEKKYRRWYRHQPPLSGLDLPVIGSSGPLDNACAESAAVPAWTVPPKLVRPHDREKLHAEVWSKPLCQVADRYGICQVTLWRRCKKWHIPLPAHGHWRRLESGLPVQQIPPLPQLQVVKEHKKEWKSNIYPPSQIALKSQWIADAVSGGQTLKDACRACGIALTTFRRWRKRLSVTDQTEVLP